MDLNIFGKTIPMQPKGFIVRVRKESESIVYLTAEFQSGAIEQRPIKCDELGKTADEFIKEFTLKNYEATNTVHSLEDFERGVVKIKQLRKDTDEIIQRVKSLPKSREQSLVVTKLQEGVMWMGMILKEMNEPNPYPSSKDPNTGATIEPTADGLKL